MRLEFFYYIEVISENGHRMERRVASPDFTKMERNNLYIKFSLFVCVNKIYCVVHGLYKEVDSISSYRV